MITKTSGLLPEGVYAVTKGGTVLGFVRGDDASDALQKASVIFGDFNGVTSSIIVSDTEVSAN